LIKIIYDLANNHQGSLEHALKIVEELVKINEQNKHDFDQTLKLQFRDLPDFVHASHREDNGYPKRFLSTMLEWSEMEEICHALEHAEMSLMVTPFDEVSVGKAVEFGASALKIASCSNTDWPLLERVCQEDLPIVASTGGLRINQIDDLVSFLEHKGKSFSLHHCVSIYPTPPYQMTLFQIDLLKKRFPGLVIGWSTHEDPSAQLPVAIAYALGARLFERHVGLEKKGTKMNGYSSTPHQIAEWLDTLKKVIEICGSEAQLDELESEALRRPVLADERKALDGLQRGVYTKQVFEAGKPATAGDFDLRFPCEVDQVPASGLREITSLYSKLDGGQPVIYNNVNAGTPARSGGYDKIKVGIHQVKAMLSMARIALPPSFSTEYSHHYGREKFLDVGTTMITIFNRDYCKKLLIQLPWQRHPSHYHKLKEESFQILWGELDVCIDGAVRTLHAGDTLLVQPGVWHSFACAKTGCVFEEVSTTSLPDDSVYSDPEVLKNQDRKTRVGHWGRFQIE
jgi:sialic acid synthase SpsE/mannose-6-phosphate isomerase-like protein (cupin superfamily)